MMRKVLLCALAFACVVYCGIASAILVPAPQLRKGQFVYSVPAGFSPMNIGTFGMDEIQRVALSLRYPYYVVFVEDLYCNPDDDAFVARAIDQLAADWARFHPRIFNVSESSIFMLTYHPRKYRFLAGSRWKSELGFERDAHKRYNEIFEKYAKGTPSDPKGGIIAMMLAVDAYLADAADPAKVAARQEAERQAQAERALNSARSELDNQITTLNRLLRETEFLPSELAGHSYATLLKDAYAARATDDKDKMNSFTALMRPSVLELSSYVKGKRTEKMVRISRHNEAIQALDMQIQQLAVLLHEDKKPYWFSSGMDKYSELLERAQAVRAEDKTEVMANFAVLMKKDVDILHSYINAQFGKKLKAEKSRMTLWIMGSLLGFLIGVVFIDLIVMFKRRKRMFKESVNDWELILTNAAGKYVDFHGAARENILMMSGVEGATLKLYQEVTAEVDAINLACLAMGEHVKKCKEMAEKAWLFNWRPLKRAAETLDGAFDFDTGKVSQSDLFGAPTTTIKVNPKKFAQSLSERYARCIEGWQRLQKAAGEMLTPAEQLFTQEKLDKLFAMADKSGILRHWLSKHPLFGDEASDKLLYDSINALRLKDPIAFVNRIKELRDQEEDIEEYIGKLAEAVRKVKESRVAKLPSHDSFVDPDDDPALTLAEAKREDDVLMGYLNSDEARFAELRRQEFLDADAPDGAMIQDTYGERELKIDIKSQCVMIFVKKSGKVVKLYEKCIQQSESIRSAMMEVTAVINCAATLKESFGNKIDDANVKHEAAKRVHLKAQDSPKVGRHFELGLRDLDAANRQLGVKQHLKAKRTAESAVENFRSAIRQVEQIVNYLAELDRQKAEFESKLAQMPSIYSSRVSAMRRYGSYSRDLSEFSMRSVSGPADYVALLAELNVVEQSWEDAVRHARREYEAEQERQRRIEEERQRREWEERERRRRREREEEEKRRRRAYSSSSGSGSSSSSGGSWGGGRSSSSGGSW